MMSGRVGAGRQVLIIGGGIHGLAAAALCAKAGLKAIVLEAREHTGGLAAPGSHIAGTLHALDPVLVRDLKLARFGLRFAQRDLVLTGMAPEGRALTLGRALHATAREISGWSRRDGEAWLRHMPKLRQLARELRRLWWHGRIPEGILARRLEWHASQSAAALLDALFESDTLKAVLAFDATAGGLSLLEPGSALVLLWHLAQEMCGLQGAAALPEGGMSAVTSALMSAALDREAEIRVGVRVARILSENGATCGVELECGDRIAATCVLSTLSRRRTLKLAGIAAGIGATEVMAQRPPMLATARLVLTLNDPPHLPLARSLETCRFVLADRLDIYASAHAAARRGLLAPELPVEVTFPPALPGGSPMLHCLIRPVPADPKGGWKTNRMRLIEIVLPALGRHFPGLPGRIVNVELLTPEDVAQRFGHDEEPVSLVRLMGGSAPLLQSPLRGLKLCGAAAEPVPAFSCRAARLAAATIVEEMRR